MTSEARRTQLLEMASPIIAQVAKSVARRYIGFIDADDLRQELSIWCWQRPDKVAEWLDPKPDPDTGEVDKEARKVGPKKLALSLKRKAERVARKERAHSLGYKPEDEWFANKGTIIELLPTVLSDGLDGYERVGVEGNGKSANDPAEGNGHLALLADVAAAWKAHPSPVLHALYGTGTQVTRKEVADNMGIAVSTLDRREDQALSKMVDYLGGENPYAST